MATQAHISVEQFEKIAALPENAQKHLEFIGGEISEMVSNSNSSTIAARILIRIGVYVETRDLGRVTPVQTAAITSSVSAIC